MNDDELRRAMAVLESYEGQIDRLNRQATVLQASMDDLVRARSTLDAVKNSKKNDEILVPIGAAVYVSFKVPDKTKVIVGIGSNVSAEKSVDETMDFIAGAAKEITESLGEVANALSEIEKTASALTEAIRAEYGQRQTEQ